MEQQNVNISQSVAILVDGNNIEIGIHNETKSSGTMLNFDTLIPKLIGKRQLNRLVYFREGASISEKLSKRLQEKWYGIVRPCFKSADIPLCISAIQLMDKIDTIILMTGDKDYVELVRHLKSNGVRVEIACIGSCISPILKKESNYYYEITKEDFFSFNS